MFHFVYKITNNINGKIYIGIHSTENIEDGYMGSSISLSKDLGIYGRENFTKEILEFFNTRKEALQRESELVNTEFTLRDNTYNINEGGKTITLLINGIR